MRNGKIIIAKAIIIALLFVALMFFGRLLVGFAATASTPSVAPHEDVFRGRKMIFKGFQRDSNQRPMQ
jgi:hypothetical protein